MYTDIYTHTQTVLNRKAYSLLKAEQVPKMKSLFQKLVCSEKMQNPKFSKLFLYVKFRFSAEGKPFEECI